MTRSKKVGREILVDVGELLVSGDGLVEGEIDFVGLVHLAAADFGHLAAELLEVVHAGLIHENVAVGEEQDALLGACFPEPPDDLGGDVGFAGAGRHDQQDAVLAFGDGLDGAIDGDFLVIAGLLIRGGQVVVLLDHRNLRGGEALPEAIAPPQFGRRWEGIEGQFHFHRVGLAGAVVENEGVAVGTEDEGHVERVGVVQRLLHAGADGVVVILRLQHRQRDAGLEIEEVIGALGVAASGKLAAHDDPAFGEGDLLADLVHEVPFGRDQRRGDEFGTYVALAEGFLVHAASAIGQKPWQGAVRVDGPGGTLDRPVNVHLFAHDEKSRNGAPKRGR